MKIQEMFDKVALHLMTQGERAKKDGICQYLTKDGLKCAAGCLIPPETYTPDFEGKGVHAVPFFKELAYQSEDSEVFMNILGELQTIHDNNSTIWWKEDLQRLVMNHQLILPDCLKD